MGQEDGIDKRGPPGDVGYFGSLLTIL